MRGVFTGTSCFLFLSSSCCCCFVCLLIFKRPVQCNPPGQRESPLHPRSEGTCGLGDSRWPGLFCRGFCPLLGDPQLGSRDHLPLWLSRPHPQHRAPSPPPGPGWLQPPVPRRLPALTPATVTAKAESKLFASFPTCLLQTQAQPLTIQVALARNAALRTWPTLQSTIAQPSLQGSHVGFWLRGCLPHCAVKVPAGHFCL